MGYSRHLLQMITSIWGARALTLSYKHSLGTATGINEYGLACGQSSGSSKKGHR